MVLICIFRGLEKLNTFFLYLLAIYISSFKNCLFISLVRLLLIGLFFILAGFLTSWYILATNMVRCCVGYFSVAVKRPMTKGSYIWEEGVYFALLFQRASLYNEQGKHGGRQPEQEAEGSPSPSLQHTQKQSTSSARSGDAHAQ